MSDAVPEVKDIPVVDKEIEKTLTEEVQSKEVNAVANGESKKEKPKNGETEEEKSVENGSVKDVEILSDEKSEEVREKEVCCVKRKSEVELESDDTIESSEKKLKVEETDEPEVGSTAVC